MNVRRNTIIAALRFARTNGKAFRAFAENEARGPVFNEDGIDRLIEHPQGDESLVLVEVKRGVVSSVYAPFGVRAVIFDHDAQMDLRRPVDVAAEHGLEEAPREAGPVRRYGRAAAGRPRRIFWGIA